VLPGRGLNRAGVSLVKVTGAATCIQKQETISATKHMDGLCVLPGLFLVQWVQADVCTEMKVPGKGI
jgi:hypothetical protein